MTLYARSVSRNGVYPGYTKHYSAAPRLQSWLQAAELVAMLCGAGRGSSPLCDSIVSPSLSSRKPLLANTFSSHPHPPALFPCLNLCDWFETRELQFQCRLLWSLSSIPSHTPQGGRCQHKDFQCMISLSAYGHHHVWEYVSLCL